MRTCSRLALGFLTAYMIAAPAPTLGSSSLWIRQSFQDLERTIGVFREAKLLARAIPALSLSKFDSLRDLEDRIKFLRRRCPECKGIALDARGVDSETILAADKMLGKYFIGPVLSAGSPEIRFVGKTLVLEIPVANISDVSSGSVTASLKGVKWSPNQVALGEIAAGGRTRARFSGIPGESDTVLKVELRCTGATVVSQPPPIGLQRPKTVSGTPGKAH